MSVEVMIFLMLYIVASPLISIPVILYVVKKRARKRGESVFLSNKAVIEFSLGLVISGGLHLAFLHLIRVLFSNEFKQAQLYILNALGLQ